MTATPSTMLPLGSVAPPFVLVDGEAVEHSLGDIVDGRRGVLVAFICNHCPYVKHVRAKLAELGRSWQQRGIGVVAINANDSDAYPDDSPAAMVVEAREAGYTFPYLVDATQEVAAAYHAACTPDFFLFDDALRLVYRGQLDGSRPRNDEPVTGADLDAAITALLAGAPPLAQQLPSLGCNIKWKVGKEPVYA